jgi:hypothetical protein
MNNRIDGILLKSQQAYMKKLGFYLGPVDGFWGEKSKGAILKWRDSERFSPANKRRGDNPFVPFERLPKGFEWGILDGQRCMMEKSNLPASFAVQELVNLIVQPTTAKVGKMAEDGANAQNSQTTKSLNFQATAPTEVSTAAAVDTGTSATSNTEDSGAAPSASEGHSAKGSSQHFKQQHPSQKGR